MTRVESQIELSSIPDNIVQVENYVEELRENLGIQDDVFGNILISLTEAVNNAIIHGNQCNPDKNVVVRSVYEESRNSLIFFVEDEGSGFDPNQLPDPTSPENLEKITGRGVFLMKQLADWVVFGKDGSSVEMRFKL